MTSIKTATELPVLSRPCNPADMANIFYRHLYVESGREDYQRSRYSALAAFFHQKFPLHQTAKTFSAPGRIEGPFSNHTDHQNGDVIALAIDLDTLGMFAANGSDKIRIFTKGDKFPPIEISLKQLEAIEQEKGSSAAIVRGIASAIKARGGIIGGFDAVIDSDVPVGSGMSSSASYEVLIGTAFNELFNQNKFTPLEIAQIGQFAENKFFGKACGLMDQAIIAFGGLGHFGFFDPEAPTATKLQFAPTMHLPVIIQAGGSHAGLNAEYGLMRTDMEAVAQFFGKANLSRVSKDQVLKNIRSLRQGLGDRAGIAIQRALHFFGEQTGLEILLPALKTPQAEQYFLEAVRDSGWSSQTLLQNVVAMSNPLLQDLSTAIGLGRTLIDARTAASGGICKSAIRVHGGGLTGSAFAFVERAFVPAFTQQMTDAGFPAEARAIRQPGAICLGEVDFAGAA